MSKTSLILFAILILCVGVFFSLNASSQTHSQVSLLQPQPTKILPQKAGVSFSRVKTFDTSQVELDVILDTMLPLKVVQLEIGYDPAVLEVETISPGTYFTTPITLLKNVNAHIGRISYALTCDNPTDCVDKTSKIVTSITFSRIGGAANTKSTVELLPKTLLKTNDDQAVGANLKGINLTFMQTPTVASVSAGGNQIPLQNR